jgi:hypothetical protein
MPARLAPPSSRRLIAGTLAGTLAASALVACADATTAPLARTTPPAGDAPAVVAQALLDFTAATNTYWSGFNFLFDANGVPLSGNWPLHPPTAFRPSDFDVVKHSRDAWTWFDPQPFRGMHGIGCEPYQNAEPGNDVRAGDTGSHAIGTWADANYRCRNHMMTSLKSAGYAVIYITPNAQVNFAGGTATVRFALSTLRTSGNDWVDLWISPWDDNLELPLDGSLAGVDLQGPPKTAVHVRMIPGSQSSTAFEAYTVKDFRETRLPSDARSYESFLTPTSTFRDTFELQISRTRLRFGILARTAGAQTHPTFYWIDTPIAPALPFASGVLQFGHHSMNQNLSDNAGVGGTWHWDDWRISPALPFTIIRPLADATGSPVRSVDPRTMDTPVRFERPAPEGARLRFAAIGVKMQVSFDGGDHWHDARLQEADGDRIDRFRSYWMPVPRGTTTVLFRSVLRPDGDHPVLGPFLVQDMTIWDRDAS